jgi:xanthine/uracil permease
MDYLKILVESIAGTTAMTAFSYAASTVRRRQFVEPIIINLVLRKMEITPWLKSTSIIGWISHYIMGFFFAVAFNWLWEKEVVPTDWLATLVLGVVAGLIGISLWRIFFKLPNEKPDISYRAYYQHLLLAHIVFTAVVYLVHQWPMEI